MTNARIITNIMLPGARELGDRADNGEPNVNDFREQQAATRSDALAWISAYPGTTLGGRLYMIRVILEPLRQVMDTYIRMSSEGWAWRQFTRDAAAAQHQLQSSRELRLVASWLGTHTDAALHQILALMNEEGALYCKGSGPRAWSVF